MGKQFYARDTTTGSTAFVEAIDLGTNVVTLAAGKKLDLSSDPNLTDGSVERMIRLNAGTVYSRPWISHFDHTARHCVAIGSHDTLPVSEGGTQLKQFEVKTIASSTAADPTELRTRFAIQYDVQRGTWGVNFIDNFEINQGENPILVGEAATSFGLRLRTKDSANSSFVAFQALATIDASDNVTVNLDAKNNTTSKTAQIIIGRNTNCSGSTGADIFLKKCDGSNTTVLTISPRPTNPTMTFGEGFNLVFGTTTGTQIATSTTQKIAFYGSTPVVKPTVTGAKGSNAALGSLMTALAALGLVVDSTSA